MEAGAGATQGVLGDARASGDRERRGVANGRRACARERVATVISISLFSVFDPAYCFRPATLGDITLFFFLKYPCTRRIDTRVVNLVLKT